MQHAKPALLLVLWLTLLTGLVYPLLVTGLCQALFPAQANGSLVRRDGRVVGSRLLAQGFAAPDYFHSRPSASHYDAMASGGSNLGPTNRALLTRMQQDLAAFRAQDPTFHGPIPADLLTASGSGLDPDISPASAAAQSARVAAARALAPQALAALVRAHTRGPAWGLFGAARVNVLELNLDLDRLFPRNRP